MDVEWKLLNAPLKYAAIYIVKIVYLNIET